MRKRKIIAVFLLLLFSFGSWVRADQLDDLQNQINDLQQKVNETRSKEQTLSSQVSIINNEMAITRLRITSTQEKLGRLNEGISSVSGKINRVEDSLNRVSTLLTNRIVRTYVTSRADPIIYLLVAQDFSDFWQRLEYLRIVQKHDRNLMLQMAAAKKNYYDQKDLLQESKKQSEVLSAQLKSYQTKLDKQNKEKQALLEITRNDEKRYQQMLAFAQQELDALRTSQFTGKRDIKKGEIIGLMGSTGNSTGPHLHFGVYSLSENQADNFNYLNGYEDPTGYLAPRQVNFDPYWSCDNTESRTFGSGQRDWPMSNPKISQCFGSTPYARTFPYGGVPFHHGVDMYDNNDLAIRAVDDGVAYFYRGTSSLGNNARVFHNNGKMTLYLHLQ